MRKTLVTGIAILGTALTLAGATGAHSKPYVDYQPGKGLWAITAVEVDPNYIDDYLTGLRRSQIPGLEVMKKHGVIDDYRVVVRYGYGKGSANVMIEAHYVSAAMLEPDQAREDRIEKEILAQFSEEEGKAAVTGYEKYRSFVEESLWSEVSFRK